MIEEKHPKCQKTAIRHLQGFHQPMRGNLHRANRTIQKPRKQRSPQMQGFDVIKPTLPLHCDIDVLSRI